MEMPFLALAWGIRCFEEYEQKKKKKKNMNNSISNDMDYREGLVGKHELLRHAAGFSQTQTCEACWFLPPKTILVTVNSPESLAVRRRLQHKAWGRGGGGVQQGQGENRLNKIMSLLPNLLSNPGLSKESSSVFILDTMYTSRPSSSQFP